MAPPSPDALAAIKSDLANARRAFPQLGNSLCLKPMPKTFGMNDGVLYPADKFPQGTPMSRIRAAALEKDPLRGPIRCLVVLVDFDDQPFKLPAEENKRHFEELFFGENGAQPSANDFYKTVSNDLISIVGQVAGPYRMPYKMETYANTNNGRNPEPNSQTMAQHAVEALNRDLSTGRLGVYDNNGDGVMDAFIVVHAGNGAESGGAKNIWSVKSVLPNEYATRDGAKVYSFLTVGEDARLGVCVHEIGHLLFGWPDFYDYDNNPEKPEEQSAGLGDWCLMAGGSWNSTANAPQGTLPCEPSAWCKMMQGWVQVVEVTAPLTTIKLLDVKQERAVFKINIDAEKKEYFLIESRQQSGFDAGMPGSGLLIFHVDERVQGNNDNWHPQVMLVQADGKFELNRNTRNQCDRGDPFPGEAKVTMISDDTWPNTRSYYNNRRSGITISGISPASEIMTFEVTRKPVVSGPDRPARSLKAVGDTAAATAAWPDQDEVSAVYAKGAALLPVAADATGPGGRERTTTDQLLELLVAKEKLNSTLMMELLTTTNMMRSMMPEQHQGLAWVGKKNGKVAGINGGQAEVAVVN